MRLTHRVGTISQISLLLSFKKEEFFFLKKRTKDFCFLAIGIPRRSLCIGARRASPKALGGAAMLPFGAWAVGVRLGRKCCVLLQCESGSGASLGVPRSAKSDRMYGCSNVSVSETAAHAFRGVMKMLSMSKACLR
jgi:hypothetical protein